MSITHFGLKTVVGPSGEEVCWTGATAVVPTVDWVQAQSTAQLRDQAAGVVILKETHLLANRVKIESFNNFNVSLLNKPLYKSFSVDVG